MAGSWTRRQLLRGGASLAALGSAAPAMALLDPRSIERLLGQALPQQLKAAMPADALQAADVIGQLLGLEGKAKALRLPGSKLDSSGALPLNADRLYESAMPRLVSLIDRAEHASPDLAEQAGGLLAKLHATQHVVSELLARLDSPAATPLLRLPLVQDDTPAPIKLPDAVVAVPQEPDPDPALGAPSTSLKFDEIAGEYGKWFAAAKIRPANAEHAQWHLTMMREARPRYEAVGKRVGIPWHFIAAIHGLEASFNFRAHLHNGDFPLSARTRQVPAGRPHVWLPPSDWESSAIDALRLMGFTGETDWSLPHTLFRLEAFNGFGYRRMGRATPYLWSFSTLYERGKYVADGRFDPNARSHQCGAAVMLKVLADAGELVSA